MIAMPTLSRGDGEIYYEYHGSGVPLLLIAGLATDSQSWLPIIDDLAPRFHVIDFDYLPTTQTGFLRSLCRKLGLPMRLHSADLFDAATARQQRRQRGRKRPASSDRGWSREDLYHRGRSR